MVAAPPDLEKVCVVVPAIDWKTTAAAAAPEPAPEATPTLNTIAGTVVKPVPACVNVKLRTVPVAESKTGATFATVPK